MPSSVTTGLLQHVKDDDDDDDVQVSDPLSAMYVTRGSR